MSTDYHLLGSAEALRSKKLLSKGAEGQQDSDRLVSYDSAAVRAALEALRCPFCGKGPFKIPARHVSLMHGIGPDELRDIAGLFKGSVICAPEYSQQQSELGKRRRDAGDLPPRNPAGYKVNLNRAAKVAAAERAAQLGRASKGHAGYGRGRPKKPRGLCVSCGKQLPDTARSDQKTCNAECFRAVQSKSMTARAPWLRRWPGISQNGETKPNPHD